MIKDNVKIVWNPKKYAIRICDQCGKEDNIKLSSLWHNRHVRKKKKDLCRHCANLGKKYLTRKYVKPRKTNEDHPLWEGGIYAPQGYKKRNYGNGKRIYEHRYMMQQFLGRDLKSSEVVHHINGDKLNNNLNNLYLFKNRSLHLKAHHQLEKIGFSWLGSKIWFSRKKNVYVMKQERWDMPEVDIIDLESKKTYYKTDKRNNLKYAFINTRLGPNRWRWKRLHVAIAEKLLGRQLYKNECVHHIDGCTLNNVVSNLVVLSCIQHNKVTNSLQECVFNFYKQGLVSFDNGIYRKAA